MEGVNLIMIYCKHFCKCHNVSPAQQKYDNKNFNKMKLTQISTQDLISEPCVEGMDGSIWE
jgi:hypothetical protein